MWKLAGAFLLGAATASAILLSRSPEPGASAEQATTSTSSSTDRAAIADPASTSASAQHATSAKPPAPAPDPAAAIATRFDPASIAASPADIAAATATEQRPQRRGPPPRRDPKSELSDGAAGIVAKDRLHPDSVSQLYDDFSAQGMSPWAASAQQAISDYLGRTASQKGFDIASVSCHESLCQIQASTYEGSDRGLAWTDLMYGMYRQAPPLPVGSERWRMDDQAGHLVILTFIKRPGSP